MYRQRANLILRKIRSAKSASDAFAETLQNDGFERSPSAPIVNEKSTLLPDRESTTSKHLSIRSSSSEKFSDIDGIKDLIFGNYLNLLLLLGPFAIWSHMNNWSPTWIFVLNFGVMIPLANILGEATEILALHTGQTIGGLVNATFGNAVEVVIAIFALRNGEIQVVQSSLIGSVLSNLLLVLGCCFVAGGIVKKESSFNATGATANSSLLMLSSFAMLLPTYCSYQYSSGSISEEESHNEILQISHIAAIFLFAMYMQLLVFQLKTHIDLFEDDSDPEEAELSLFGSSLLLLISTLLVALFSEFLVGSIDGFTSELSISKSFVGIIILPIVGNAVEHVTAVKVALNDKMELAMGVAVGSGTQVSLFVVPVVVIAGWVMGQPMTLAFPLFETMVFLFSIIIVYAIVADGKSNWLEGSMLLTAYALIAVTLLWIKV